MITVDFEGSNGALDAGNGKKVPILFNQETRVVTTCWELSPEEILEVYKNKRIYLSTIVQEDKQLQPIMPSTKI